MCRWAFISVDSPKYWPACTSANTFEEVVAKAKKIHNDLKRKAKVVGLSSPYPAPRSATRRGAVGGAAIAAVMGESEEDEEIPIAAVLSNIL